MDLIARLERQPAPRVLLAGFALIGLIGLLDLAASYELALSLFYVLPIALITWRAGRRFGLAASALSALLWISADLGSGHPYSHPLIPFWNTSIRLAYFVLITLLLSALQHALAREHDLARLDYLTGAVNSRAFHDLARAELDRLRRYQRPLTLAYIDLDNFKAVNDGQGHSAGNEALRAVAAVIRTHIRRTDVLARLGGDEFALLLLETDSAAARAALDKVHAALCAGMQRAGWPITFSIGVVTCTAPPASTDELVKMADDLMYAVKHDTKAGLRYAAYAG